MNTSAPWSRGRGTDVYICGECVLLCQSILDQEMRRRNIVPASSEQNVRETFDKLVSGQEHAKSVLLEAAFHRSDGKGRVLLIGSSPSSQKFLARGLAHTLNAPFAAGDARSLSTSGNSNLFFELLIASDFNVESAQQGVVYVTGLDKADAQGALVRLWQDSFSEPVNDLGLDVRGMLFICGGAFSGLNEAIRTLGRHPEQAVTTESLLAVGLRSDVAKCFAGIACVPPLDEASLSRMVGWADFGRVN
jgi:ATP-dependent Clp protease ATP-binding subunit ClpX